MAVIDRLNVNQTPAFLKDGVFDISEYNNGAVYTDLSDALGQNGINIPPTIKKGGMSVKFIQSNEDGNRYVQYMLMTGHFNTTKRNWQGVENTPTLNSFNLVDSNGIAEQIFNFMPTKLIDMSLKGGCYAITDDGLEYNNTGNWRYVIISVKNLASVVTYAGTIFANSKVPAIIYLTGDTPIESNRIAGAEQYADPIVSQESVSKFENKLIIPDLATYAIINVSIYYLNDSSLEIVYYSSLKESIIQLENEITSIDENIDNLEDNLETELFQYNSEIQENKYWINSLKVSQNIDNFTSLYQMPCSSGCYSITTNGIEFSNSGSWKNIIIPVNSEIVGIKTEAGAESHKTKIPAIIYLTGDTPIESNRIAGAEQYGKEEGSNDVIKIFNACPTIPENATHIIINCINSYLAFAGVSTYGEEVKEEVLKIKNNLEEHFLYKAVDTQLSNLPNLNNGVYNVISESLAYSSSSAWKYAIISVKNLVSLGTFAGRAEQKVPAIIYLTGDTPIESNRIAGAEQYGTEVSTYNPSIYKFVNSIVIPQGATHAIINCYSDAINDQDSKIRNESYLDELVDDIQEEINEIERTLPQEPKVFIVKATSPGEGEYSTISAAVNAANQGDIIKIYPGVYEEQHINIKRGMHLEGIGDVEIRGYLAASTAVKTMESISTLECYNGAILKNLKITAKNMRYPIHADFSDGNALWDVENCTFIHYGNNEAYQYQLSLGADGNINGIVNACSAWGGGTRGGDVVRCFNCTFISTGRGFSTHNNAEESYELYGPSHVSLDSCIMISKAIDRDDSLYDFPAPLFVQSLNCPVDGCDVVLRNCKLNNYVVFQNSGGDGWKNKLKIFNSGKFKICFSSYGSGLKPFNQGLQISTYQLHTDKFPETDFCNTFINRGNTAISIGHAVKKTINGGIANYNSNDDEFFGIAMENIPVGSIGKVWFDGYLSRIYLEGLRTTTLNEMTEVFVNVDGTFSTTGTKKVFDVVDCENVVFLN